MICESNNLGRGRLCLCSRSHNGSVSVIGHDPRSSASEIISKAVLVMVTSGPVVDGTVATVSHLSHTVAVQVQ